MRVLATALGIALCSVLLTSQWLFAIREGEWIILLLLLNVVSAILIATGFVYGMRPILLFLSAFGHIWIITAATYQLATDDIPWNDGALIDESHQISLALVFALLSMIAFSLGYEVKRAKSEIANSVRTPVKGALRAEPRLRPLTTEHHYLRIYSHLLAIAALALLPLVLKSSGGLGALFSSRSELGMALQTAIGNNPDKSALGVIGLLPGSLATVAGVVSILQVREAKNHSAVRISDYFPLFLSICLIWTYRNPMANTRFAFAAAVIPVILAFLLPRRRRDGFLFLVGTVVGLLLVYPLMNTFRGADATIGIATLPFGSIDFDGFQQLVNTVGLVSQHGISFGWHTLSALLFFVPRSIWPTKAMPASFEVAEFRGYTFQNLSLPLPAELLLDFGWVGGLLCCLLLGVAASRLDNKWFSGDSAYSATVAIVSGAVIGLFRGPLGSQLPVVGVALILDFIGSRIAARQLAGEPMVDLDQGSPEQPAFRKLTRVDQESDPKEM